MLFALYKLTNINLTTMSAIARNCDTLSDISITLSDDNNVPGNDTELNKPFGPYFILHLYNI